MCPQTPFCAERAVQSNRANIAGGSGRKPVQGVSMADTRPIALLTDFGTRDPFAGVMNGVILGINPDARIIDLGHEVDPGDIRSASFGLRMAFPYFPEGAVFLVVVDPGVGTDRRGIAAEIDGKYVVCPDNGLLSWLLHDRKPEAVVELADQRFHLPDVSGTFHGRDIFAPVAAHLSIGVRLSDLGPPVTDPVTFEIPVPAIGAQSIQGEIVYIDRFGNLITNIDGASLGRWLSGVPEGRISVQLGSRDIEGISRAYGDVLREHTAALVGSSGFLEIGINQGNAADYLGIGRGFPVMVYSIRPRH